MRIDGFLLKLNQKIDKLAKNSLLSEELKTLSYFAAESKKPVNEELLEVFINAVFCSEDESETAHQLLHFLLKCKSDLHLFPNLQPNYIVANNEWALHTLIEAMLVYNAEERIDALSDFNQHQLAKILLNGADFRATIRNIENYLGTEDAARSVLMAFGYYYYEMLRNRTEEHKHFTGSWTGYAKATKQKGIDIILKVLESGKPLDTFVKQVELELDKLSQQTGKEVKGAINQGELGAVYEMAVFASNPENRQLKEKNWFGFARA